MTRSSLMVRFGRLLQSLPLWIFQVFERPLARLIKSEASPRVIFILALPRSGSTVTYQSVVHALDVNYLSNIMNLLYQLPLFGGWIARLLSRSHYSDFKSRQGFVGGLDGPAEGLRFWSWWLDSHLTDRVYLPMSQGKRKRRLVYLRKVFGILSRRRPFVTAYLGHTLIPDTLANAFPDAIFIRLRRDPVDNALSILKCMESENSEWFSVWPKECEEIGRLSPHERVAAQVYWLNRRLDDALVSQQYLEIAYERLCLKPHTEVSKVIAFCQEKGWNIGLRHDLPDEFKLKKGNPVENDDVRAIEDALAQLENSYGRLK